jgi:hypothetical protein
MSIGPFSGGRYPPIDPRKGLLETSHESDDFDVGQFLGLIGYLLRLNRVVGVKVSAL